MLGEGASRPVRRPAGEGAEDLDFRKLSRVRLFPVRGAKNPEPEVIRHHRREPGAHRKLVRAHLEVGEGEERVEPEPAVAARLAHHVHGVIQDVGAVNRHGVNARRLPETNPHAVRMRFFQCPMPAVGFRPVARPDPFAVIDEARNVSGVAGVRNGDRTGARERDIGWRRIGGRLLRDTKATVPAGQGE